MDNHKLTSLAQLCLSLFLLSFQTISHAEEISRHPLYLGALAGYGSTTWGGLVPNKKNQNPAMSMSTPTQVNEGGSVWGLFAGYEISPLFAVEGNYMQYPDATVFFNKYSLFSFTNGQKTEFITHTETLSLMGKIMLMIPGTPLKLYSSVGAAEIHRRDLLTDDWRLGPTFGLGLNIQVKTHIMVELGGTYTAGYGEAQLNPTEVYFPFLYAGYLRFAYRF